MSINNKYLHEVKEGGTLRNKNIEGFVEDAVRITGSSTTIDSCVINDTLALEDKDIAEAAHRDEIQIIATGKETNAQFFGAGVKDITITNNTLVSSGKAQLVFSSDGYIEDIKVVDNVMDTGGAHSITLNGCKSGVFANNLDRKGNPIHVQLDSLRLLGGHTRSFKVINFSNPKYNYAPVHADNLMDLRGIEHNPNNEVYVRDFDLDLFRELSETTPYEHDGFDAHVTMLMSKYDALKVKYRTSTMWIENGYLFVPNRLDMADQDHAWWNERWTKFKPYEMDSDNFDIIISIHALDMLEVVRIELDRAMSPTNAYRNERHNNRVGGAATSDHTFDAVEYERATGFDIPVFTKKDARKVEAIARKYGFNAIGKYPKQHFIHIGIRTPKANGAGYNWGRKWQYLR